MQIRDATIDDLPDLVNLWFTGVSDNTDFDAAYPWRRSAPDDFRRLLAEGIERSFLEGQERFLVVEADTEQRQVVAWVSWTRNGSSDAAKKIRAHNDSFLKTLERTLRSLQETVLYPFAGFLPSPPASRDEGPLAVKYNEESVRFRNEYWVGDFEENWFVKKLCVDPEWRRQGIAKMLLQWGLDRAQEEGVVVGLNATELGVLVYTKMGFEVVGVIEVDGLDVRVPVLMWRPKTACCGVGALRPVRVGVDLSTLE